MCPICHGTGYVMQDIGTATVPDYIEIRCRCNPAPTDAEFDDFGYPGETEYPADLDLPKIDYDAAIRNPLPLA